MLVGCSHDYSQGSRTGTVIKFSKKGLMFKTWEGSMNLGGLRTTDDGVVANTFEFSIDPTSYHHEDQPMLIKEIQLALDSGYPIELYYNQEYNTNWFSSRGSTNYFPYKVRRMK